MAKHAYQNTNHVQFKDRRVAQNADRAKLIHAKKLLTEALEEKNERQFVHKLSEVFKITRDISRDYILN